MLLPRQGPRADRTRDAGNALPPTTRNFHTMSPAPPHWIAAANVEIEGTDVGAMTLTVEGLTQRSNKGAVQPSIVRAAPLRVPFLSGGVGPHVTSVDRHALFDLDGELQSRLDLSKLSNEKVKNLMSLDVLLLAC